MTRPFCTAKNHPELTESQADKAVIQANLIADTLRDMLRMLAPADPAIYSDTPRGT